MLDAVDRWLEALLPERLGGIWQLSRASGVVDLRLAGSESRIRLQSSSPGIFDVTNSEVPCSSWDAERKGGGASLEPRFLLRACLFYPIDLLSVTPTVFLSVTAFWTCFTGC